MKLTKKQWVEHGVRNSHDIARHGSVLKVFISYRPAEYGLASNSAAWQIIRIGYLTHKGGHWRDNGHKTFSLWNNGEKEAKLKEAMAWAKARYGFKKWERDPWGDWHPEGTMAQAAKHVPPKREDTEKSHG